MTSALIYFVSAVEMVYWGFGFFEIFFLCSPQCPGTHSADQVHL